MKKTIWLMLALIFMTCSVMAQETFEEEAWKFAQAYDQSIINIDVAFLEKHLAKDFFSVGPNSYIISREEAIESAKKRKKDAKTADYTVSALKSNPVKIDGSGNLVVITSNWRVVRTSNTAINATPQVHTGTTTAVYRKTDKWELLSEHVSFDKEETKDIVRPIGEAGQKYIKMLVNNNVKDIDEILTKNYLRSIETETYRNRETFLDDLRQSKLVFNDIQTTGIYINVLGNNAIETGKIVIDGSRPGEESFLEAFDYTRTWIKQNDKWQITTEQYTLIKKAP